jgi:hypothetical protein
VNLEIICTPKEFYQYTTLLREYFYSFAWSYDDLKAYDETIFQHIIPLKEGTKSFKQKLRIINPKLNPLVKIEIEKLKKVGINFPIRHSKWLSSPVIVRKKMEKFYYVLIFEI